MVGRRAVLVLENTADIRWQNFVLSNRFVVKRNTPLKTLCQLIVCIASLFIVLKGCYRTRLGSTDRLRRHIILCWGNRNVVTRDTRKAASRLRRKGKRRRWKGDFVGAKARIRRLHFNCLVEQYKLNDDVLLFFRSC